MDFREKIDKILSVKEIKLYKLAEISGLGNTLEKAYADNREMRSTTTDRFIHKMGINPDSWDNSDGPEFLPDSERNITSVQNQPIVAEKDLNDNLDEVLEKVEASKDYYVIPRAVLKDNYRLVAIEQFQIEKERLERERDDMKQRAEKDRVYLDAQIEANRDLSKKLDILIAKLAEVQKS